MFDLIGSVLAFFYDQVWDSYGMAVVFLTLAVMIVATPLTLKSTKSMLQMQRLQPELKAIQARYKDDRQKMNEELMAFYQENGINPLGGCLPMLIQLPIFLVLFRVVRGITQRATDFGNQFGWSSGRVGAGAVSDTTGRSISEQVFEPQHLPIDSDLYQSLSHKNEMVSWGIDLSQTAQNAISEDLVSSLPYLLLIVVVLVSSLYQQRQIQGRNTGAQINPQQQMIMKILPFMLPVFSFTMPAALVIYFVVSNLYRIGQQGYITKSLYKGDDSPGAQLAKQRELDKAGGKSGAERGGGRVTPKKGEPTPKRGDTAAKTKTSNKKASNSGSDKKTKRGSGAGRTGNAPSRESRSGGRTTDPGSRQHKKRKK